MYKGQQISCGNYLRENNHHLGFNANRYIYIYGEGSGKENSENCNLFPLPLITDVTFSTDN